MDNHNAVKVSIAPVRTNPSRTQPHYVRWRVAGRQHWKSFATKDGENGAAAFHAALVQAVARGMTWDKESGLPRSLHRIEGAPVAQLAQQFMVTEWARLSPNTRRSYGEALVAFTFAATRTGSPAPEPERARSVVLQWLCPIGESEGTKPTWAPLNELDEPVRAWLLAEGLTAGELDGAVLKRVDAVMRRRPETGIPYARTTQNRLVNPVKRMLREAGERGLIDPVEWPMARRGAKAKSEMGTRSSREEVFPTIEGLRQILRAMESHQPASKLYQTLSAVCAYGGLRPGEAVALTVEDIDFEAETLRVERAWHGGGAARWNTQATTIAGPKTERSYRTIAIPRPLHEYLQEWTRSQGLTTGRLFVTRTGGRPTQTNWIRALARACEKVGWSPAVTPYDLRRIHASHLVMFVPITEAAERLGHSVDVLTKNYLRKVKSIEAITGGWDDYSSAVANAFEIHLWDR